MKPIIKTTISLLLGVGIFLSAQASAEPRDYRPDRCTIDHDHRSHSSSYYNYYPKDKYFRTGSYSDRRSSYDSYDRRGRVDRDGRSRRGYDRDGRGRRGYDRDRGHGQYDRRDRRRARSRVVFRETYRTNWNARIVLVEEIYWTRSGREQLVCSVVVKGRDAHQVPNRRLRRIANRDCSRSARVQYRDYS